MLKLNARTVCYLVVLVINLAVLMMRVVTDQTGPGPGTGLVSTVTGAGAGPGAGGSEGGGSGSGSDSVGQKSKISSLFSPLPHVKLDTLSVKQSPQHMSPVLPSKKSEFDSFTTCHNQSTCIKPFLQVQHPVKVYFCKHSSTGGVRFYYLIRDGLLTHPQVRLVEFADVDEAEYVIYLPNSGAWHKTECSNTSFANKLIVLDEFDGHSNFAPFKNKLERQSHYPVVNNHAVWKFLFFKRSYVRRHDGEFQGFPHLKKPDVYPLTYSIMESYIQSPMSLKREIEILCTLRGSKAMSTRLRVQQSVQKYIDAHPEELSTSVASQLSGAGRRTVSNLYFTQMHNSSIIVTVNPAYWEGDFRLWEAMSSGALVFVDPLMVPHPYPLLDKKHVIYFSQNDESDLFEKLDYYRAHKAEARAIALQGYYHAMKHHRTSNTIDYILRTAVSKSYALHPEDFSEQKVKEVKSYKFTGQYIVAETKNQEKSIKKNKLPGDYYDY